MPFRAASQYMFIMECPLDILPVPNKICPALFYCTATSFTMIPDPGQEFFGCQQLIFIDILIEPSFCDPFFILCISGHPVDVFHQMEPVCYELTLIHITGRRPDPVPSIAVDINAFQYVRIIVLPDISIYRFPQGRILVRSRIKSPKIEWRDQLPPAI